MGAGKPMAALGLLFGAAALTVQFFLIVPAELGLGRSLPVALVSFFSYFTILTNLALVLVYAAALFPGRGLSPFRHPVVRASAAASIVLVMGFYHLLLSGLWNPQGLYKVTDVALHYLAPVAYLAWWAVYVPHGRLAWRDVLLMLAPSLAYLVYIMARGALVHEYPYAILAADELGYGQVAINAVFVALALALISALLIAADKILPAGRLADA